jgi:hypothetical protein
LLARVNKADWSASGVQVLDITSQYPHAEGDEYQFLRGWSGGFATGGYAYVTQAFVNVHPPTYSEQYRQGQWVVKVDESDFHTTSVLNVNDGKPPVQSVGPNDKVTHKIGLTDGTYGYVFGHGTPWVSRIHLSDFTTVDHVSASETGARYAGGFISRDYLYAFSFTNGIYRFVAVPAPAPTPPTMQSATGDPHLQNIHGERFDLMRSGKAVLIEIPRGQPFEKSWLTVEADAHRLGSQCADMYFQSVNITGAWADKVRAGGLAFTAGGSRDETLQAAQGWTSFGPLKLKVVHGRTSNGIKYLNFYIKHLSEAGAAVGGLLGEDDYTEAATPEKGCLKSMSLEKKASSHSDVGHTEAIASLA